MMHVNKWTKYGCMILCFLTIQKGFSQVSAPHFIAPVTIPISLAGNFCEIRANHFHSGVDIRTNGKEGLPVLAIGNGYISRIKISPTGFGRAIYINHPEGYTSVYAHLNSFTSFIAAYVDSIQRANESYDMEIFPDAKLFQVVQGDTIALSGNSGSSASPHLHFEIRDLKSEEPLNPLTFLNYKDSIAPTIKSVRAVRFINEREYIVLDSLKTHHLGDSIINYLAAGKYYFEIQGTDNSNDSYGNYYSIKVITLSGDTLFSSSYDRFNFDETKMVNTAINYESLINSKEEWIRLYKLPNNTASLFKNSKSHFLNLSSELQSILITVSDFNGNSTTDTIQLIGSLKSDVTTPQQDIICRYYDESFSFPFKYGFVNVPKNGIDHSYCYPITDYDTIPDSTTFLIGDPTVALIKTAQVMIQQKCSSNSWLCERNSNNELTGTSYKLDSTIIAYQAIIKKFGWYSIEQDSVAPKILKASEENDPIIPNEKNLLLKISDDISGIKKANVYINNVYLPCEFDLKRNTVIIPKRKYKIGDHLQLKLVDYQGNEVLLM
ncbi:MAG: M23 family metallopeptidase [Bacteroidota bacterium]